MFRSRSWFGGGWGRPKNPHSLDHLKYLYNVLARNQTVSEHNRGLLVESLRSIAEILIWGDQNDSSVFDFFLEKNMLSFFLRIMRQRSGGSSYVCVQLLQTLNILFENIRNETSLYYLLSNNHVNSIIVHKFDFSDEEVMAYYISFLKTLSFKLNGHTIHFFYNEHTNDFPLYTEAIKFFNHRESMVRIAVRTLTLNVYRVEDASMLRFIRDRTAAPYFSNLVWFIGKHILELDVCVRNDADHLSQQKLSDLVAEHLDHLHYLNDILCLNIGDLNQVLTEHLLHKLFIPLYIYSLTSSEQHRARLSSKRNSSPINSCNSDQIQHIETITRNLAAILNHQPSSPTKTSSKDDTEDEEQKPRVSCVVALFLLSQVFLIITHAPLVHALAWIILHSNNSVFEDGATKILENYLKGKQSCIKLEFAQPSETLEIALAVSTANIDKYEHNYMREKSVEIPINNPYQYNIEHDPDLVCNSVPSTSQVSEASSTRNNSEEDLINSEEETVTNQTMIDQYSKTIHNVPDSPLPESAIESDAQDVNINITDEEKEQIAISTPVVEERLFDLVAMEPRLKTADTKPFLETILKSLDCSENDYIALFALCLLYALVNNKGINPELLDVILTPSVKAEVSNSNISSCSTAELSTPMARASCAVPLYSETLVDKLINIIQLSCQPSCRVRLVSLELSLKLLSQAAGGPSSLPVPPAVSGSTPPYAQGSAAPQRRARAIHAAKLHAATLLRTFYKTDDIFLDMFEDEYCEMCKRPLNVEWLCMDAAILLPPTGTPMTGIAFTKRLPCGEVERARRAIRAYFLIRELSLSLSGEVDNQLPLTSPLAYVQIGNVLDLNNSDLIACTIVLKDGSKSRRFMVIDPIQIILVEPEQKRLGWGVAKLVGSLQDLEVTGDKEDSRCLHLRVLRAPGHPTPRQPLLQAKFVFDDHIRCMAAKQRLIKGRLKARQKKMQQIGRLLEVSGASSSTASSGGPAPLSTRTHRPLFSTGARVPGFAAALRRDSLPGASPRSAHRLDRSGDSSSVTPDATSAGYEREVAGSYFSNATHKVNKGDQPTSSRPPTDQRRSSSSGFRRQSPSVAQEAASRHRSRDSTGNRSRSGSPRMPRPRSEEIPLENMATEQNKTQHMVQSRLASPDLLQACAPVDKEKGAPPADPPAETSFIRLKKKSIIETI